MSNWVDAALPPIRIGLAGWLRVIFRGSILGAITYGGLAVLLLVRLVEWPLFGQKRPLTPFITQFVCKAAFVILRLPLTVRGRPMTVTGAVVANHSSWLDVFALNASQPVYFVAKSEVEGWPAIGWLARATGTVFINRKGHAARQHQEVFENRLKAGHRLLFFPEGTSTDAIRVLAFKSTLFQAFYADGLREVMNIQPVTVIFHAPAGQDPRFYGWWGEMDFASHLIKMLATRHHGSVEVIFHPEVPVAAFENRKVLAAHCERVIRASHTNAVA